MAANASKKTYTVHITYTSDSPISDFERQKNDTKYSSSDFRMNSSFKKPVSNCPSNSGVGKTKSILKAQPSDYQGFTFQMNDTGPTYCKNANLNDTSYAKRSSFEDHSKPNRRVRLFLDNEQTAI